MPIPSMTPKGSQLQPSCHPYIYKEHPTGVKTDTFYIEKLSCHFSLTRKGFRSNQITKSKCMNDKGKLVTKAHRPKCVTQ